jgi:MFS family permease
VNAQTIENAGRIKPPLFYGWVVVVVGFVTLGVAFGVWYSFSVFFLAIVKDFGWSRAAASSIFSIFIISQALTGLLAGLLQDRFGPRVVIPVGSLIVAVALALSSRAQSLSHLYLTYGLLAGAGVSLLGFSSHAAFIPKWFERKRGLAVGIAMSGIGFGMLVLIPLMEKAISRYGWRNAYLILAALVLFVVAPLNLLLSRRSPEALNLRPDGDKEGMESRPKTSMVMKIVDPVWAGKDWTIAMAARTRRFWFLMLAFFFLSFTYQGTLLHAVSAMVDAGLSRETGAYYFGILGIAGSTGKVLLGYLSDLFGREKINTVGVTVAAIGISCLLGISAFQGPMALVFAILFGLGYGAAAPLLPSVSADIFLGKSFGLVFAMICIGGGAGGSTGSFVTGLLRDISGSYSLPFSLFYFCLSVSCVFIWLAGPRKVRRMIRRPLAE